MLLTGGVCLFVPVRTVMSYEEHRFTIGPPSWDAKLSLGLGLGQAAKVTVIFEEEPENGWEVWGAISYMYPTKQLVEVAGRFVNQTEVSFVLGWENATYLKIFITDFIISIFLYETFFAGEDAEGKAVVADCIIIKMGNPVLVAGVALLIASAAPLWAFVLNTKRVEVMQVRRQHYMQ